MTAIEQNELKGITVKNVVVTLISTVSIVVSVMTTYFQLKNDIHDVKMQTDTQSRITEIRLKALEGMVVLLQQQVDAIKNAKQFKTK